MSIKEKNKDDVEELLKYRDIFTRAWETFLKRIEEGRILVPVNEAEFRCHLFSICLSIMQEQKLPTPYQIFAEQELLDDTRLDLGLGYYENERGRLAAIELYFPTNSDVVSDLKKLKEYEESKHVVYCFFAMIGNPEYVNEQSLGLSELGIEKNGKHSFYQWHMLKSYIPDVPLVTLIVGFMSPNK